MSDANTLKDQSTALSQRVMTAVMKIMVALYHQQSCGQHNVTIQLVAYS